MIITEFPSPLEVDWFLYPAEKTETPVAELFPSPLEVDRFLYGYVSFHLHLLQKVSVPSRGG